MFFLGIRFMFDDLVCLQPLSKSDFFADVAWHHALVNALVEPQGTRRAQIRDYCDEGNLFIYIYIHILYIIYIFTYIHIYIYIIIYIYMYIYIYIYIY